MRQNWLMVFSKLDIRQFYIETTEKEEQWICNRSFNYCEKCGTNEYWYKNGQLHRDSVDINGLTLPAVIRSFGTVKWYQRGMLHRDEYDSDDNPLPAVIYSDGDREWHNYGMCHHYSRGEHIWVPRGRFPYGDLYFLKPTKITES